MKFIKESNLIKNLDSLGDDVIKQVRKHIKSNVDMGSDSADDFLRKYVSRVKVKKGGETVDIRNKSVGKTLRGLNPFAKDVRLYADLDKGNIKAITNKDLIRTEFTRKGNKGG